MANLSGCLLPRTKLEIRYDPSQGSYIHENGTGAIDGQAFLVDDDGDPVYAAGRTIFLIPATDYAVARVESFFRGQAFVNAYAASFRQFANSDPDYLRDQRTTRANYRGRFKFDRLAPGRYIVMTNLTWVSGDLLKGGAFFNYVTIEGTETVKLVLSIY